MVTIPLVLTKPTSESYGHYQNFKYRIVKSGRYIQLVEYCHDTEIVVGQVSGWRGQLFSELVQMYEGKNEREKGYRLFLALALLKRIKDRKKLGIFARAIVNITLEETIFWVWQYHSYGTIALTAFKCIHINHNQNRPGSIQWR